MQRVLDVYSRAIVGWQLAIHMRSEHALDAFEMANGLRRPGAGLIAHSDPRLPARKAKAAAVKPVGSGRAGAVTSDFGVTATS